MRNGYYIESEKGTFIPLIFTTSGGTGPECTSFFKRLAEHITDKSNERYAKVISNIRTGLRFSVLRSTLYNWHKGRKGYIYRYNRKHNINLSEVSLNLIPNVNSYECR